MEIVYLESLREGIMINFQPKNGETPVLIVGTMKEVETGERKNSLAGNETA